MKSRVGKCRVLTDTPEKDRIAQDYVRQQEKLMKSTKAKRAHYRRKNASHGRIKFRVKV
jgi:hypothetical protein